MFRSEMDENINLLQKLYNTLSQKQLGLTDIQKGVLYKCGYYPFTNASLFSQRITILQEIHENESLNSILDENVPLTIPKTELQEYIADYTKNNGKVFEDEVSVLEENARYAYNVLAQKVEKVLIEMIDVFLEKRSLGFYTKGQEVIVTKNLLDIHKSFITKEMKKDLIYEGHVHFYPMLKKNTVFSDESESQRNEILPQISAIGFVKLCGEFTMKQKEKDYPTLKLKIKCADNKSPMCPNALSSKIFRKYFPDVLCPTLDGVRSQVKLKNLKKNYKEKELETTKAFANIEDFLKSLGFGSKVYTLLSGATDYEPNLEANAIHKCNTHYCHKSILNVLKNHQASSAKVLAKIKAVKEEYEQKKFADLDIPDFCKLDRNQMTCCKHQLRNENLLVSNGKQPDNNVTPDVKPINEEKKNTSVKKSTKNRKKRSGETNKGNDPASGTTSGSFAESSSASACGTTSSEPSSANKKLGDRSSDGGQPKAEPPKNRLHISSGL